MSEQSLADRLDELAEKNPSRVLVWTALLREAAARIRDLETPAWCYDPADWVETCEWGDRDYLTDGLPLTECMKVERLAQLRPVWAVRVAMSFDENGDPDEEEAIWCDTEAEAQARLAEEAVAQKAAWVAAGAT